jgi:hypothetical protein
LVYLFVNWNIFSRFGMYVVPRKIWQPWKRYFAAQ